MAEVQQLCWTRVKLSEKYSFPALSLVIQMSGVRMREAVGLHCGGLVHGLVVLLHDVEVVPVAAPHGQHRQVLNNDAEPNKTLILYSTVPYLYTSKQLINNFRI